MTGLQLNHVMCFSLGQLSVELLLYDIHVYFKKEYNSLYIYFLIKLILLEQDARRKM